jgi:serine/threonine-protein kinase
LALTLGTRLGVYEVTTQIGAGGMGEVYRATDSNLKRSVAIKVLPASVAGDADRLARFQREAEVLAALNHPNIGAIYGLEKTPDCTALIMELVEGDDLSQRIARGPIPLDEALPIAKQITDALEAAHEQGIIHRDLKPANIKVRSDGTVKVLDFGLAKAMEPASAVSPGASRSPTITSPAMTEPGIILGTAAYMSPEQARGKPVDRRTDIWAFGCVLYEMLTARRAFAGDEISDTLAEILKREPDWTALPSDTPSSIMRLLRRCLHKDRARRLQHIGDARIEIEESISGTPDKSIATRDIVARRRHIAVVAAASAGSAALIGALVTWIALRPAPSSPEQPVQFEIVPPPTLGLAMRGSDRDIAISPDGRQIVYRAGGQAQLALRELDRREVNPLPGITNARVPFFSPDGQWIGFFEEGTLKKVPIRGGTPVTLWESTDLPRGGSWGDDGHIVFATQASPGLLLISASGGSPTVLTTPDPVKGERNHWHPSVLPGGRGVLFTIVSNDPSQAQIAVLDFNTRQQKTLVRGGSQPEYLQSGHLVYSAARTLRAVRFDIDRLELAGEPSVVVDDVWVGGTGASNYAVSRSGTLVHVSNFDPPRSLVWVERTGRETPLGAPLRGYASPRLSPDGSRIAVAIRDREHDIHVYDLKREAWMRLASNPSVEDYPIWTPDGKRIVFSSQRHAAHGLYAQAADGSGTVEQLTKGSIEQGPGWVAPDGSGVLGREFSAKTQHDIVWFPLRDSSSGAGAIPERLLETRFIEVFPEVSPNGRYVAYQSNVSGRTEIYVRPFPSVRDGEWRVSNGGGTQPTWAKHGKELFYVDPSLALTAVPVDTSGSTFSFGNSEKLFELAAVPDPMTRDYDVAPDGRFLMVRPEVRPGQAPQGLVVVLNWIEELKAKLP